MSGKLPEVSAEQRVKHTSVMFVAYVVISMPFLLVFDELVFIGVQVFMFVGVNLIEEQFRRMNSTALVHVQSVAQAFKFALLSLAWPLSLGSIRAKADAVYKKNQERSS